MYKKYNKKQSNKNITYPLALLSLYFPHLSFPISPISWPFFPCMSLIYLFLSPQSLGPSFPCISLIFSSHLHLSALLSPVFPSSFSSHLPLSCIVVSHRPAIPYVALQGPLTRFLHNTRKLHTSELISKPLRVPHGTIQVYLK